MRRPTIVARASPRSGQAYRARHQARKNFETDRIPNARITRYNPIAGRLHSFRKIEPETPSDPVLFVLTVELLRKRDCWDDEAGLGRKDLGETVRRLACPNPGFTRSW